MKYRPRSRIRNRRLKKQRGEAAATYNFLTRGRLDASGRRRSRKQIMKFRSGSGQKVRNRKSPGGGLEKVERRFLNPDLDCKQGQQGTKILQAVKAPSLTHRCDAAPDTRTERERERERDRGRHTNTHTHTHTHRTQGHRPSQTTFEVSGRPDNKLGIGNRLCFPRPVKKQV